jgi:hypothetical protein
MVHIPFIGILRLFALIVLRHFLSRKYSHKQIDNACRKALNHGAWRLQTIRKILEQDIPDQQMMSFIEEHPIIRDMSDYQDFVTSRKVGDYEY